MGQLRLRQGDWEKAEQALDAASSIVKHLKLPKRMAIGSVPPEICWQRDLQTQPAKSGVNTSRKPRNLYRSHPTIRAWALQLSGEKAQPAQ